MMNSTVLYKSFISATTWNSITYFVYKGLQTVLSIVLFHTLSAHYFATWANFNSIIYLVLLWLDGGFNKSIARFIPEFSKNTTARNMFIRVLIFIKIGLIILALPIIIFIMPHLCTLLNLALEPSLIALACITLITQGIVFTIKMIYHAHFWNKEFNIIQTGFLTLETLINIALVSITHNQSDVIFYILTMRIMSGTMTIGVTLIALTNRYRQMAITTEEINTVILMRRFFHHSLFIWFSTIIKSMTERNVMLPLLTYLIGHQTANIFKIANDGALFVHRFVTTTIGTADTTFLTHAILLPEKNQFSKAFKELSTKIINLSVIAVIAIVPLGIMFNTKLISQTSTCYIFLLLAVGYLLESLLSPYERVLEIKRSYVSLLCAYIPYIFMLLIITIYFNWFQGNLITIFLMIHVSRLMSALIMTRLI